MIIYSFTQRFADLFRKYYDEVYPARLVFTSFLRQTDPRFMVEQFKKKYPGINVLQFQFTGNRPDLSKLDNVFGLLLSEIESFLLEINEAVQYLRRNYIFRMAELLKV